GAARCAPAWLPFQMLSLTLPSFEHPPTEFCRRNPNRAGPTASCPRTPHFAGDNKEYDPHPASSTNTLLRCLSRTGNQAGRRPNLLSRIPFPELDRVPISNSAPAACVLSSSAT